jgi:hypothetical protein
MQHTYAKCTRTPCPTCKGQGGGHYPVFEGSDDLQWFDCRDCDGNGRTSCTGCRPDSGMDCLYEALAYCSTCGALEGALLPWCPGKLLEYDVHDANYQKYCAGIGPFATPDPELVFAAQVACYWRTHTFEDGVIRTHINTSEGAQRLFDAVQDLYQFVTAGVQGDGAR